MVFLMMGVAFFNGTVGQAAEIHVTTTADNVPGSLRAAITEANTNGEDDIIDLPAGTYYLSGDAGDDANVGGDLDIDTSRNLTITGAGNTKTYIDGNGIDRVLHILNGTISISDLTIRNGNAMIESGIKGGDGGGIYNCGNLTLTRCVIKNNAAGHGGWFHGYGGDGGNGGGIHNIGILTIDNCTITGNSAGDGEYTSRDEYGGKGGDGGGIFNKGTLTVDICSINNNRGGNGGGSDFWGVSFGGGGGGVYNEVESNLNMSGCAVYGNVSGSGDEYTGRGGGICNWAYLTLINCTISKNQTGAGYTGANGGGLYNGGHSQLINVTLVNNTAGGNTCTYYLNGGGIFNEGTISLKNSIAANNHVPLYYGQGPDCFGTFNWVTYSLIEDTGGCTLTGTQKSNILGKDPLLGPLKDNGGPTYTHALLPGSPAIDAGNSPNLSEDQRGYTRPIDIPGIANVSDGADIGAYEFNTNCSIFGTITFGGTGLPGVTLTFSNNGGTTTTGTDGHYSHTVLYNWSGTVTPAKVGYTFTPSSRNYTSVTVNQSNQDYTAASLIPPQISLNRTQLYFGADTSGKQTGPQSFLISNSGGGILNWTAAADTSWLGCNPAAGTGPTVVTVSINPSGLTTGTYYGTITIADTHAINSPQIVKVTLIVYSSGSKNLPWGSFDTPISGATVTGSIPVTGWALDNIGIESVKIYRNPVTGEGSELVYIGDAIFVEGARPDVEAAYPGYPNNYKAGWGYLMLTNALPGHGNGTFTLYAKVTDKEGNTVPLGTKIIYCDNAHSVKPFGALDTPAQGGTASGSDYINFGWALTPLPNTIPFNGSTITAWVDGIPLGHPVYNEKRPDVAALFPTYNNSAGAGGHYQLDTTKYQNGVHTISWSVKDNAGNTDGIGSRYFTVQNLAGSKVQELEDTGVMGEWVNGEMGWRPSGNFSTPSAISPLINDINASFTNSSETVRLKKGFNTDNEPGILYPDENGSYAIEIKELERIVLYLDDHETQSDSGEYKISPYCQGFLIDGSQLRPLPIGSTLDALQGVFYWQPGPGFLGSYEFLFIEKTSSGERMKKHIIIRIAPHSSL